MLKMLETAVFYNMVDKQKMLEMLHLRSILNFFLAADMLPIAEKAASSFVVCGCCTRKHSATDHKVQ